MGPDAYFGYLRDLVKKGLFVFLIVVALLTRFIKLNWGNGFFFHPDENNMGWATMRIIEGNLNPHFFAYGQFPLFLTLFVSRLFSSFTFEKAILTLRFWSALFSFFTLVLGYFLAKDIFKKEKSAIIYTILLIFAPGLIQSAHFGTTESFLTFAFLALSFLSCQVLEKGLTKKLIFWIGAIGGMALATKASAIFLFAPVGFVFLITLFKEKKKLKWMSRFFLFILILLFFVFIFAPFHFLEWREAVGTTRYETNVAMGKIPVFYTRQFIKTLPVVFQVTKIFPWLLGLPNFVVLIATIFFLKKKMPNLKVTLLLIAFLGWFLPNVFLFVKWTRFMVPVLPLLILPIAWLISLSPKWLLIPSVLPGIIFLKIYLGSDIRLQATNWLNENLPADSTILSEAGNVINLPLFSTKNFTVTNFDFYNLENDLEKEKDLKKEVLLADFFLSPSRRVFANCLRLPEEFPKTADFYQKLFSGKLGFIPLKEIKVFNQWEEIMLGTDLASEETWTVFDHPTIRIYQRE